MNERCPRNESADMRSRAARTSAVITARPSGGGGALKQQTLMTRISRVRVKLFDILVLGCIYSITSRQAGCAMACSRITIVRFIRAIRQARSQPSLDLGARAINSASGVASFIARFQ